MKQPATMLKHIIVAVILQKSLNTNQNYVGTRKRQRYLNTDAHSIQVLVLQHIIVAVIIQKSLNTNQNYVGTRKRQRYLNTDARSIIIIRCCSCCQFGLIPLSAGLQCQSEPQVSPQNEGLDPLRACVPSRGMASQSCSYFLQISHSMGDSSFYEK